MCCSSGTGSQALSWNARSRTEYLSASFQAFLRPYQTIPRPGTSENSWLKQEKTRRSGGNCRNNWTVKDLTVKEGLIQDAIFITADPGHAPQINLEDQEHKHAETKTGPGLKKVTDHVSATNYTPKLTSIMG